MLILDAARLRQLIDEGWGVLDAKRMARKEAMLDMISGAKDFEELKDAVHHLAKEVMK